MHKTFTKKKKLLLTIVLCVAVLGVVATVAYLTDVTGAVKNRFSLGDAEVTTEITEETGETDGNAIQKSVAVKNIDTEDYNEQTCFIRVRVTCSPDYLSEGMISLACGTWSEGTFDQTSDTYNMDDWVYADGYYYYLYPVESSQTTEDADRYTTSSLFDAVVLSDAFAENPEAFDVTIYEESVYSMDVDTETTYSTKDDSDWAKLSDDAKLSIMQNAFASLNQ